MTLRNAAELELSNPRGGRIFGRVTDEQGRPIPGAHVGYNTSGNTFSGTANWEDCDPDGRYAWDGKVFDRPTRLRHRAPGYLAEGKDNLIFGAGSGPLELNFRLGAIPTARRRADRRRRPTRAAKSRGM